MLFLYVVCIFRTLEFLPSGHVFELWSSICVAVLGLTDLRRSESMPTSPPSAPHACSRCLPALTRVWADLLRAWQAFRRHLDIVTIILCVLWTPSWASQRERGGADQIEGA